VLRQIQARPRLFVAALVAILIGFALPSAVAAHVVTRALVGWNAGADLYVLLAALMMARSSRQLMRQRAQLQDDGETAVVVLASLAAVASLAAIAGELAVVKDTHGLERLSHVALAGLTVVSSWAFIQVTFALHYAHEYYAAIADGRPAGLRFPDDDEPDYADFFYFAAIIGTSGQTADVAFVSKPLRRIGSMHCILAYLFNTVVLALLINIGASLL
jgi:uncharacterized membrane protein